MSMKLIDAKDPYFVLPLIIGAICLLMTFLLYPKIFKEEPVNVTDDTGFRVEIGSVSKKVETANVKNKLDAYEENYGQDENDRFTAVETLNEENQDKDKTSILYTEDEIQELLRLEKLKEAEKESSMIRNIEESKQEKDRYTLDNDSNKELESLINEIRDTNRDRENEAVTPQRKALDDIREQYLFLDSLNKANDPDYAKMKDKELKDLKMLEMIERENLSTYRVTKDVDNGHFNTIKNKKKNSELISAIIDENIKGYAGSRIRLRLLEDINIGNITIPRNTYLYAIITGFNDQRVMLDIVSLLYDEQIYPVKLNIYDVDGIKGLYVPASQFREFTKELGQSTMQGMNTNELTSGNTGFMMSMVNKMFTTTSSAIAKLIRQNKVNLKYSSNVYLVDEKLQRENREKIYKQHKQNNN